MKRVVYNLRSDAQLPWRKLYMCTRAVLCFGIAIFPLVLFAHPGLDKVVEHDVDVTVRSDYIDISLEFSFAGRLSLIERRKMDIDVDGNVSSAELSAHLRRLVDDGTRDVSLRVAGRHLAVIPLYAPDIELLGGDRVAPLAHIVRLSFFARRPAWLSAGHLVELQVDSWHTSPAVCFVTFHGVDGWTATLQEGCARSFAASALRVYQARLTTATARSGGVSTETVRQTPPRRGAPAALLAAFRAGRSSPETASEVHGATTLSDALLRRFSFLLTDGERSGVDEIHRRLQEAAERQRRSGDAAVKSSAAQEQRTAATELIRLLKTSASVARLSLTSRELDLRDRRPIALPADAGAFLLQVAVVGSGRDSLQSRRS